MKKRPRKPKPIWGNSPRIIGKDKDAYVYVGQNTFTVEVARELFQWLGDFIVWAEYKERK